MSEKKDVPEVELPVTGLSEKQQLSVMMSFSKVLESRLEANTDVRLTAELKSGLFHVLRNELDQITKSVIVGSTPDVPGLNIDQQEPALTDNEVDELIINPDEEGEPEQ